MPTKGAGTLSPPRPLTNGGGHSVWQVAVVSAATGIDRFPGSKVESFEEEEEVRATSQTRLRARDQVVHFKHSHWRKRRSWANFASHYTWWTNGVCEWTQDGCEVYMDSYVASNGSCSMMTWTIFKNHLLEVGLTQNREIMALWTFTTVDLFYFIMREDPRK